LRLERNGIVLKEADTDSPREALKMANLWRSETNMNSSL
jgi:hypothetical protein